MKKTRWLVPVCFIIAAILIQVLGPRLVDDDGTISAVIRILGWLVAIIAILIWWLFFSKLRWRTRFLGIAVLAIVITILSALFRFEGFTGGHKAQFSSRLASTKEERAIDYFADRKNPSSTAAESLSIAPNDWPRFRGPANDQTVNSEAIRTDWDTRPPKQVWRQPCGSGWSSFIAVGDYLYTQEQRGEHESIVCYSAANGEQIWIHQDQERFEEAAGGPGPRATPTLHTDGRLYAVGATGMLNCLDPIDGKKHWSTDIVSDCGGELIDWAISGSPVIHEDLVLVNPGTDQAFIAAYDRLTGEKRWQGPEARAGYATPIVMEIQAELQVVIYRADGVGSYALDSGKELWFHPWSNAPKITVAQPIPLPDGGLFVSAGYGGGSILLDITKSDAGYTVTSRWERPNKFKLKFNSGIHHDSHIYGLDEGVLSCFDLSTGKRTWKKGRYGYGQILMVKHAPKAPRLIILTEQGDIALLDISPETMTELARFPAIEGKTWNHPVLRDGRIYLRNDTEAACYDLR